MTDEGKNNNKDHKNDRGNNRNCCIKSTAGFLAFKVKWVAGRVEAVVGRVIVGSFCVRQTVRVLWPHIVVSRVAIARAVAETADTTIASAAYTETAAHTETAATSSSIDLKGNQEESDQISNFHFFI